MTKTDEAARIGTPEAAVRACVALIASVTGQPEELTERYLDLYYQTRRAADREKAREDFLLKCDDGTPMLTMMAADGPPRASAPTEKTETAKPAAKVGPSETRKKVDFEEVLASASTGARKTPEKQKNQPWGSVKREIRERFIKLRGEGMTLAQAVNLSDGKLNDGEVLVIMNGGKAEMKIYNALEDAMNKWEKITRAQITAIEAADEKEGA